MENVVKTTCPRDCYDACGMVVHIRDGAITKVLGDPAHPVARGKLCKKCAIAYNGAWRDPKLRLQQPLRRTGPKGEGRFTPISWDEALAEIAARFTALSAAGAADTILHTHYTGTVGLIGGWFPLRFFQRLGATEVDPDTVCNKAGHAALELTFGDSLRGFDPRAAVDAKTIVVWGANPSHTAPHQDQVFLQAARARGTRLIVIDPIRHDTARAADLYLQLRPGTDSALAFAMLHVIDAEGLADRAFLAEHVLGAEALAADIAAMTPARAEALTGVAATDIAAAARAYAGGPSLLWLGQGLQRQPQGGNVFRALGALVAFTGNVGKPGAGFLYMNGTGERGVDLARVAMPSLARSAPPSISHMDFAAALEDSSRARALVNWNNNPAASSPEQARLRAALKREDLFHVAVDLFHTDTTAYADIVLPAASFLECDDLVLSYFDLTVSAQAKAADPMGAALPNAEIFRRLARAMGYSEPELYETDQDLLGALLAQTTYKGTFADLTRDGTHRLFETPRVQFPDLTFPTPSGRIELASERALALGLPFAPTPHADPRPAAGRLRVISPASPWLMNSSYGNDPAIRRHLGPPTVLLHPADAAARDLLPGSRVTLTNENGALTVEVIVSDHAQPGVGVVYKGRWPGAAGANVNVLVPGRKSDLAESTTVHAVEVDVTPALAAAE